MFAAREGHIAVVNRLLETGADINAVMQPADTGGRAPRSGMSALMLAVENGHFELAMTLVNKGADLNDQRSGFTPLHAITWVRKTEIGENVDGDPPPRGSGNLTSLQFVRELVAAGADVNLQLKRGSAAGQAKLNMRGATPFLLAAKTADVPLLRLLVELGADPHLANVDGCTPLMAAVGVGVTAVGEEAGTEPEVLETIELLISLGADPNVVDRNGETAMHGAAYRNYPRAVALLAEKGADPSIWNRKNRHGWTPMLIAAGNRPGSFKPSPETIAALAAALPTNTAR
jgi:ankyrin repeat protein